MKIQDILAKIKPLKNLKLVKLLKRSLESVRENYAKIRRAYAPVFVRKCQAILAKARKLSTRIRAQGPVLAQQCRGIRIKIREAAAKIPWAAAGKFMQQHRKRFALAGGILGSSLLLRLLWPATANPYQAFEEARLALSAAHHAEAKTYTPKLLQMAESRWERAHRSWHFQNQRWRLRRNYQSVIDSVTIATRMARQASTLAVAKRDSLQWLSATGITLVKDKIDSFKAQFNHLPVQAALRKKFLAGELAILESELAFNRRDYFRAVAKYRQAAGDVGSAGEQAGKTLRAYLSHLPKWRRWVEETIAQSKQDKDLAIVVDKMAANVQIYEAGILRAEYPVELGPRWVGHKRHRGDGATPEGRYRVLRKKDTNRTIYHKALEINYPNDADQEAFQSAVARGELPRGTHIGGLIEIHGEGGKGANWTAGCVALRNAHMDAVFKLAKVGTPVTIVGSLKGLPAPELNGNSTAHSTNGAVNRKKS